MIFQITYVSQGLKVKGYVAFPNEIDMTAELLETLVQELYPNDILEISPKNCSILIQKKEISKSLLPAIIYCRGGIGNYGAVKLNWLEDIASHGFIVFAPCYRGSEGGEGRDEFGGADVADTEAAYELVSRLPFVHPSSISILGFSRGAINAVKTVVEFPAISSLILWGGVSDLKKTYEERVDLRKMLKRVLGGTPRRIPKAYEDRSPLLMTRYIHCPVLLMHGRLDNQVPFSHGQAMYDTLVSLNKKTEFHRYDGYGHHLPLPVHTKAINRMCYWIKNNTT